MPATIKEVAARAGVSTATVSYVLNGTGTVTEATRQRVLAAASALDYQPSHAARAMRGRSYTLGLALPATPGRLADPALAQVLANLADTAAARGYALLLVIPTERDDPARLCVNLARSGRVDGLILLDVQVDDERARALAAANVPHICAGPAPAGSPAVASDDRASAHAAVMHLVALGHQRIGFIQLPSELAESDLRYGGYVAGLETAHLEPDAMLTVEAGRREEDGYQAMQELLNLPEPPSAVLACSDELAFGAMHAAYDAGYTIGETMSIVGFDDTPLAAHSHPPLTTIRQPRQKLGTLLATTLIDSIDRKPTAAPGAILPARLIIRRSTGPNRRTQEH